MTPTHSLPRRTAARLLAAGMLSMALAGSMAAVVTADASPAPSGMPMSPDPACSPAAPAVSPGSSSSAVAGTPLPSDAPLPSDVPAPSQSPAPVDTASAAPDTGTGNAHGDVPDNAVFLTYQDATHGFSIQYVEGWQVTPGPDGVVIRDKDSSETVRIVPLPADLAGCVSGAELPTLQAMPGFSLIGQDTVKVHGNKLIHLTYHLPAPPDPVTGKRVPSTVDQYYVPGVDQLAVVSLSTPDGVDNVDAFRQMIKSLTWS
ncbi:MAG: hypothetical protein LH650_07780 [Chloroflexi bacterium]|nr:hypothetical protein [Chloroflexota bacterium]